MASSSADGTTCARVSPAYGKTTTNGQTAGILPPATLETSASTYATTGSFGAQYSLAGRFGLFGEIGLNYSRQSSDSSAIGSQGHSNTCTTRSGVGVIVYF